MADMAVQPSTIISVNPASGEVLGELPCATTEAVHAAVERARSAQRQWSQSSLHERLRLARGFQQALQERRGEVAELISREAGKPYVEALLTEVVVTLDAANFYLREAKPFLRPQRISHGNPVMKARRSRLCREPYGVIGIISPWNYPFSIPASEVLAALVMGNAVVLKPSEFTPLCALRLQELWREAGLPDGLLQVMVGDGSTGAALTQSAVDKLIFTGSVATGRRIAQAAAERLLPVVLELGGKDPMVALDDANLEVASSAAVWGAFMNAGQTCLSVERCYVHRGIFDQFVEACVRKTKALRVGMGSDSRTDVGPLIHPRQLETVESQVSDAVRRGATVLAGGTRLPGIGGNFYAPTILVNVNHSMRIMREESFGPVLPIMPFDSEEQAVQLANDSEFGLAASVWTNNRARGEALARKIQAGTVMVNDLITCFGISEAPHGGVKASGLGRTHGRLGMEEMVRVKYVDSDLLPNIPKVWWYGYGADFRVQMEGFADLLFSRKLGKRIRGALYAAGSFFRKGRL